jgi:hypothetical protein
MLAPVIAERNTMAEAVQALQEAGAGTALEEDFARDRTPAGTAAPGERARAGPIGGFVRTDP